MEKNPSEKENLFTDISR